MATRKIDWTGKLLQTLGAEASEKLAPELEQAHTAEQAAINRSIGAGKATESVKTAKGTLWNAYAAVINKGKELNLQPAAIAAAMSNNLENVEDKGANATVKMYRSVSSRYLAGMDDVETFREAANETRVEGFDPAKVPGFSDAKKILAYVDSDDTNRAINDALALFASRIKKLRKGVKANEEKGIVAVEAESAGTVLALVNSILADFDTNLELAREDDGTAADDAVHAANDAANVKVAANG